MKIELNKICHQDKPCQTPNCSDKSNSMYQKHHVTLTATSSNGVIPKASTSEEFRLVISTDISQRVCIEIHSYKTENNPTIP